MIELIAPRSPFGCPCGTAPRITGWSIEDLSGETVYQRVYPVPMSADTSIVWQQQNLHGAQVSTGFYRVVIRTTDRILHTHIRIVDRANCRVPLCQRPAKPCGVPFCDSYLRVSPAAVCGPCCDPCRDPCCHFPFFIVPGTGK